MVASFPSFPPMIVVSTMVQHSQHTEKSQHSNEDVTIDSLRVSNDGGSREKYDLEIPVEEMSSQNSDDDHPDGGFTAWLMVAGVRLTFSAMSSQSYDYFLRRCAIHARRKYFNRVVLSLSLFSSLSSFIACIPRERRLH
jgi:hypothetical protein